MTSARVLVVHHPMHSRTKSHSLFDEIFPDDSVAYLPLEANGAYQVSQAVLEGDWDAVILFQMTHAAPMIQKIHHNVVAVPMFDGTGGQSYLLNGMIPGVKILALSKSIATLARLRRANVYAAMYMPRKEHVQGQSLTGRRALFFVRPGGVSLSRIVSLGIRDHSSLTIHDPFQQVTTDELGRLSSSFSDVVLNKDWLSAEKYKELLDDHDTFLAPRNAEGIGMAVLEALARGKVVVAPHSETMSSYLGVNKCGVLYGLRDGSIRHDVDWLAHHKRTIDARNSLHATWLSAIAPLRRFVLSGDTRRRQGVEAVDFHDVSWVDTHTRVLLGGNLKSAWVSPMTISLLTRRTRF